MHICEKFQFPIGSIDFPLRQIQICRKQPLPGSGIQKLSDTDETGLTFPVFRQRVWNVYSKTLLWRCRNCLFTVLRNAREVKTGIYVSWSMFATECTETKVLQWDRDGQSVKAVYCWRSCCASCSNRSCSSLDAAVL